MRRRPARETLWPESEEHMAKLSVNAMIGLARSTEVYSVRSSSELDGARFSRPSPTRGAWCGTSSMPGGC